jgi:hypothetical protein
LFTAIEKFLYGWETAYTFSAANLLYLCEATRDSGYSTGLQRKEGAQLNVENVYCNCECPLGWETAYTITAADW